MFDVIMVGFVVLCFALAHAFADLCRCSIGPLPEVASREVTQ